MQSSIGWPCVLLKLRGVGSSASKKKNGRMDTEAVVSATEGFVPDGEKARNKNWATTIIRNKKRWWQVNGMQVRPEIIYYVLETARVFVYIRSFNYHRNSVLV